jgi:hypothetical protein
MRVLLAILLIAALSLLAGMFLPWWTIAIVSFLVALLLIRSVGLAFLAGFAGVFLLWTLLASWIDVRNDSILSSKIAQILPLGGSSILLVLITGLIGGLVGGFAAMAGTSLKPYRRRKLRTI